MISSINKLLMDQSTILQSLGWALINSLWQMAFLWVIFQLVTGSLSRISSHRKALFATIMIFSGFAWFVYTFISNIIQPVQITGSWEGFIQSNNMLNKTGTILPIASVVYLVLLTIPVYRFIKNYRYVGIIRKNGLSKIDAGWRVFVNYSAAAMGITKNVRIWLSEYVVSPVTIGFLKPVILLPVSIMNNLSPQQVESIILHELVHIKRYDYLVNLLINAVRTVLYFNPFLSLFIKVIEKERENSCDEQVLQFLEQPVEYAEALLLLEKNVNKPMLVAATGNDFRLLGRIEQILGIKKKPVYPVRQFVFSLGVILIAAAVNFFFSVSGNRTNEGYFTIRTEMNPYHFYSNQPLSVNDNKTGGAALVNSANTIQPAAQDLQLAGNKWDFNYSYGIPVTKQSDDFYHVNYLTPVVPDLSEMEDQNIKQVIAATKKVLEKNEWKELEKSYADAYTSEEKQLLHHEYLAEIEKIDWKKLEDKIKISYKDIDWNKVKGQLAESITQMHYDSLQLVMNKKLTELCKMEDYLKTQCLTYIPDTDIKLELIQHKQKEAKAQLEKLSKERQKKTIKL